MGQPGRKRKPGNREPSGRLSRAEQYVPAVNPWTELRRKFAVGHGNDWRDGDASWLIGCWFQRGELIEPGETHEDGRARRDAAEAYLRAIDEMRLVLDTPPVKDSLAQFQPRGSRYEIDEERKKRIQRAYQDRFECLGQCGRAIRDMVHRALHDDGTADRLTVIKGLQALVDAELT